MMEAVAVSVLFVALWSVVAGLLATMCVIDVRERRIPNKLVAGVCVAWALMQVVAGFLGAATGLTLLEAAHACGVPEPLLSLFALPSVPVGMLTALAAVLCLAAMNALYERLLRRQAMGVGDVKLIGAFALFLGPVPTVVCVMLACLFALVGALPLRMRTFPFAPALIASFVCVVFIEL